MEVHHHAHTARQKWTHYLWEFVMLFLAVFCGFLAEYQLEHLIEKDREKQYMRALYFDLRKDREQADSLIQQGELTVRYGDSLLLALDQEDLAKNSRPAFRYWLLSSGFNDFVPNDGTIQQLKNSGSLRLIHDQDLVGHILDYIKSTEVIRIHQLSMNNYMLQDKSAEIFFDIPSLYHQREFNPVPLLTNDKKALSWAFNHAGVWKNLVSVWKKYLQKTKAVNKELSELISKEYSVK